MALARTRRYACVLALGCVIRGDTPHFEFVALEAASGLQLAGLETGIPVSFGVLTCDTREQAEDRAGEGRTATRAPRPRLLRPSRWRTSSRLRRAPSRPLARRSAELPPRPPSSPGRLARPPVGVLLYSAADVQGLRVCGKKPLVRAQPQPLDGCDEATLQSEPPAVRILVNGVARRSYVCARCLKAGKVQKAL